MNRPHSYSIADHLHDAARKPTQEPEDDRRLRLRDEDDRDDGPEIDSSEYVTAENCDEVAHWVE